MISLDMLWKEGMLRGILLRGSSQFWIVVEASLSPPGGLKSLGALSCSICSTS